MQHVAPLIVDDKGVPIYTWINPTYPQPPGLQWIEDPSPMYAPALGDTAAPAAAPRMPSLKPQRSTDAQTPTQEHTDNLGVTIKHSALALLALWIVLVVVFALLFPKRERSTDLPDLSALERLYKQ